MKRHLFLHLALLFFGGIQAMAQEKPRIKFGNVTAEDFKKSYSIDSNAAAVVIADIGSTEIVGNTTGSFSLLFKRLKRVHILNKNGYDAGNVCHFS